MKAEGLLPGQGGNPFSQNKGDPGPQNLSSSKKPTLLLCGHPDKPSAPPLDRHPLPKVLPTPLPITPCVIVFSLQDLPPPSCPTHTPALAPDCRPWGMLSPTYRIPWDLTQGLVYTWGHVPRKFRPRAAQEGQRSLHLFSDSPTPGPTKPSIPVSHHS
jgi:hypothetical protein